MKMTVWRLVVMFSCFFLMTACGSSGGGGGGSPGSADPQAEFNVQTTFPADGAVGVDVESIISVTFSNDVDPATVNNATFVVSAAGATVQGHFGFDGNTVTFTPSPSFLDFGTIYEATIATGVEDLNGETLAEEYSWSFTTAPSDPIVPQDPDPSVPNLPNGLVKTTPVDKAINVSVETYISAEFVEEINSESAAVDTFFVNDLNLNDVQGTIEVQERTITFIPDFLLESDMVYEATITTYLEDLAGESLLEEDYTWSFTTMDTIPPAVVSFSPEGSGIPVNTIVAVTFSKPIDPASINAQTLTLSDSTGAGVEGIYVHNDYAVIFIPTADLAGSSIYYPTLAPGVADLAGNLAEGFSWSFTTRADRDLAAPEVIAFGPKGAGVWTGETIWATFNEIINPYSVNDDTFVVRDSSGAQVIGVLKTNGATVNFTPASELKWKETYTVSLAGIEDMARNSMEPESWNFTTGMGVVSVTPSPNRNNVAINQPIYVVFSEPVDPGTVNSSTFSLVDDKGVRIIGTLQVEGAKVTFKADANFVFKTIYTASLSTGIASLEDGEQLPREYTWKFRAGKRPLRVHPRDR